MRWFQGLALTVTLAAGGSAMGATIYTEQFPRSGSDVGFPEFGWNAHIGATATATADNSTSPRRISAGFGKDQGYYYGDITGGSGSTAPTIIWTDEQTIDRDAQEIETISVWMNNTHTSLAHRFVVRIGGNWFATAATFSNADGSGTSTNWATQAEQAVFNFTTSAAAWRDLAFVPDTTLALGDVRTEPLPAGDVTAFGIYHSSASGSSFRLDLFEISAVPEPAALSLIGLGMLLVRRRR